MNSLPEKKQEQKLCPFCKAEIEDVAPGWKNCPKCEWESLQSGQSIEADMELSRQAREMYADEQRFKKSLVHKWGGGSKGRRKNKKPNAELPPWVL